MQHSFAFQPLLLPICVLVESFKEYTVYTCPKSGPLTDMQIFTLKDVDAEFPMRNVFTENLRGARAAILCYAVTDPDSWERLQFWVSLALFIKSGSTST